MPIKVMQTVLLVLLLLLRHPGPAAALFPAKKPIVQTDLGAVRGIVNPNGVNVFHSVPFGAPTGGANRFAAPRPACARRS